MDIPLGYKLKILKRIKNLRQDLGMSVPESRGRPESALTGATRPESAQSSLSQKPQKSALKQKQRPQDQQSNDNLAEKPLN
jgi:hypothetical protein